MKLHLVPVSLAEANEFVRRHHRHHQPVPGCKFCVAAAHCEAGIWQIVGVAIVGRPVARMLDDGWTLELNLTCVSEARNANSFLYGACRRAAFAIGYKRLITYTLPEEGGVSLRASGWTLIGEAGAGTWNRTNRPRVETSSPAETSVGGARMSDLCFWDPANNRPAQGIPDRNAPGGYVQYTGCANEATVRVGSRTHDVWHLCDFCAELPRFRRYKKHPLRGGS